MDAQNPEMRSTSHSYHIGDVAALTGLTPDALRAWERVGLLTPRRSSGGVRRHTEDDIARIRLIARTLQSGGFSRRAIVGSLDQDGVRRWQNLGVPTQRRSGSPWSSLPGAAAMRRAVPSPS